MAQYLLVVRKSRAYSKPYAMGAIKFVLEPGTVVRARRHGSWSPYVRVAYGGEVGFIHEQRCAPSDELTFWGQDDQNATKAPPVEPVRHPSAAPRSELRRAERARSRVRNWVLFLASPVVVAVLIAALVVLIDLTPHEAEPAWVTDEEGNPLYRKPKITELLIFFALLGIPTAIIAGAVALYHLVTDDRS